MQTFIIHTGDIVEIAVIDELEQIAPVFAVCRNMDGQEMRGKLPKINSINVFDWEIGVKHDSGALFSKKKA